MLIDCTHFFNDYDMLECRLKYLWDSVDLFLVYESDKTFSGQKKEFNLLKQLKRFQKYSSKMLYIPITIDVDNFIWDINAPKTINESIKKEIVEDYQRSYVHNQLKLFDDNDHIIFTDLDEIPNILTLDKARALLRETPQVTFLQWIFYYNFNTREDLPWAGPFITTVANAKRHNIYDLRLNATAKNVPKLPFGGWHLSHWGSIKSIQEKIAASQHQELNKEEFTNDAHILECQTKGIDLYNRNIPHVPFDIKELPKDFYEVFKTTVEEQHKKMAHFADSVEGYFYEPDYKVYREVVAKLPNHARIVEVGSFKGRSSSYMAVEIINSGKDIEFYCVDTWEGSEEHQPGGPFADNDVINHSLYETFIRNMKPVEGYYKPIRMRSTDASKMFEDNSLDFVYIDAAHDYDSVKEDIEHWILKVKPGGIIGGHDGHHDPVRRAIKRTLGNIEIDSSSWTHVKK